MKAVTFRITRFRLGPSIVPHTLALLLLLAAFASAGEVIQDGKSGKEPVPPQPDQWHLTLALPSWIAWIQGKTGLNGTSAPVNVGFDNILKHLDMVASGQAEVSKGKFGIYGELLYLSLSDSIHSHGILRKADLREDEYLADIGLRWRLIENDKGYLDAIVGSRYTNIYERAQLHPNSGTIEGVSENLARASTLAEATILARQLVKLGHPVQSLPVPPLTTLQSGQSTRAVQAVTGTVEQRQKRINDRLHHDLSRGISRDDDWFDPYIGLRGHYNLNEKYYLDGRVDVGGFSIGSDFTCEAIGGVGCHLSPKMFAELNFKLLYVDYSGDGFTYRTSTFGPELLLGMTF